MPSSLTAAHIEAMRRLRRLTTGGVERIWIDLGSWDRKDVDQWLSRVLPLVDTAQRQSVALTEAYLARYMGRQPLGLTPSKLTGAAVRNGTPPAEVYERSFVTLWSALGSGSLFEDASSKALARATGTSAMDVQLSMRATADAVEREDDGIFGFERAADPGACAFCQEVDGAYVKSGDAMALHNHCGCGLEPLTKPHHLAANLPSGVAVEQHGELGAVLVDPKQNFTSEADLAHVH